MKVLIANIICAIFFDIFGSICALVLPEKEIRKEMKIFIISRIDRETGCGTWKNRSVYNPTARSGT
jgi:hypothetical protein